MKRYRNMTFAGAAKKISDEHKDRDLHRQDRRAFEFKMEKLIKLQMAKQQKQGVEAKGNIPKMAFGGPIIPGGLSQSLNLLTNPQQTNIGASSVPASYANSPVAPVRPTPPPVNPLTGPQSQGMPTPSFTQTPPLASTVTATTPKQSGQGSSFFSENMFAPLALGKGVEFLGKASMLAGGYDKVKPQTNSYESQIRKTMGERNINLDSVRTEIAGQTSGALDTASQIRSPFLQQAIGQSARSRAMKALTQASLQEQQINNQYRAQESQVLNNLGQQKVQAQNYAEQLNNQSKVGFQTSALNMLESVGAAGQELTNFRAGIAQQQMIASAMRTKDFMAAPVKTMISKAIRGKNIDPNDLVQIINNSDGKSPDVIQQELDAAVEKFKQSF